MKSFSETFPIARSNSSSLSCAAPGLLTFQRRTRSAAERLGPRRRASLRSGPNARNAANPTAAAAKTVRLRRMMAAAVWPLAKKTTMVAPIRPASVKNCQGSNGCVLSRGFGAHRPGGRRGPHRRRVAASDGRRGRDQRRAMATTSSKAATPITYGNAQASRLKPSSSGSASGC